MVGDRQIDVVKRGTPRYPFVVVDVREEHSKEVVTLLFKLGAAGVERRDEQTLRKGPGAGFVTVVGDFASHDAAEAALEAIRISQPILLPRLEEIVGDAWRNSWKRRFEPFALTPHVTVVPPWSVPTIPGVHVLVMEPGRAFGTGLHVSTSLAASLLEQSAAAFAGKVVLDVGTGTGILALTALALGAARAVAVDVDPASVSVARKNAAQNGLADKVDVHLGSAADVSGRFALVLANIEAPIFDLIAEELVGCVAPGGRLVMSGILSEERDAVIKRYEALGLRQRMVIEQRETAVETWVAITLDAPQEVQTPALRA